MEAAREMGKVSLEIIKSEAKRRAREKRRRSSDEEEEEEKEESERTGRDRRWRKRMDEVGKGKEGTRAAQLKDIPPNFAWDDWDQWLNDVSL